MLDPIARPAAIVPKAAAALPEISADYRTFTVHVRPGIFFTPHPSFGGKPRELTATDFAYCVQAHRRSESSIARAVLHRREDRRARRTCQTRTGRGIGVRLRCPGVRAGRHRSPDASDSPQRSGSELPVSPHVDIFSGVAREAVEAEGETYGHRPVGSGAFTVAAFVPGQRIEFARNPAFRQLYWEDLLTSASRGASRAHPMRGKRLPGVDRIEFSSTPEASSELLALRNGELDVILLSAPELATQGGELKPDLAKAGLRLVRDPAPFSIFTFFNMRDPMIGGEAREKVALRRAIAMAFDDNEYSRVIDAGLSTARQQVVPPGIDGYLSGYRSPNMYDLSTANALLERVGYKRGQDGYRRSPDGSALTILLR